LLAEISRPRRQLRALGLAGVLAVLLPMLVPPAAADDDVPVLETSYTIAGTPEPDQQPVRLDLSLFVTDPGAPRPAVVLAHGFGGTKDDSAGTARTLARLGYAVITYTARGFGASGGRIHLDNPAYEGADARRIVDFAAGRPEVASTGNDPVIGFAGVSYGGAAALQAAGLDRRIDAIAPAFTWNSLTQALFPQYAVQAPPGALAEVTSTATTGVFKKRWAALFFRGRGQPVGNGFGDPTAAVCGRFALELCRGYLETAESGRPIAGFVRLLEQSSVDPVLPKIAAPTLIIAGEQDTLFPLDQADANLRGLPASTPTKMIWVAGGHDAEISTDDLVPELEAWFGRYLRQDGSAADTAFEVVVAAPSLVGQDDDGAEPQDLTAAGYPGRGSELDTTTVPLAGDAQSVISPAGGTPTAITSLPGTGGLLGATATVGGYALAVLPGQAATFTSTPLQDPYMLVGSGSVSLRVTSSSSSAALFVGLWDLGPDVEAPAASAGGPLARPGTAVLPQAAVAPIKLEGLTPGRPTTVVVALPPVAHEIPVGHRFRLVVSSTDQAYAVPAAAATYQIDLVGDRAVTLPQVGVTRVGAGRLDVPLALVVVVGALVLMAAGLAVAAWLLRRALHTRPDLAHLPLVVDGLTKTYTARRRGWWSLRSRSSLTYTARRRGWWSLRSRSSLTYTARRRGWWSLRSRSSRAERDGFKAVDGVSFVAQRGQVVGLLGPNGAGKTTTLRMMVGLIRPDAGTVYVHGGPVHGGAEVLGSVGALIEGPGFLPHLTGRENLLAYWGATGRPLAEAVLDDALAVAGLGSAIDRRVRGYSQGMRQRLGIAQAMLGRPDLLLLDEPTNGLDPPQIKTMRTVLRDYAAGGRTVVVSSHLLSEVEQTCSDVVVMHQGRVVLTGSMAALTGSDDVTLVGLSAGSDLPAAARSLQTLGVRADPNGAGLRISGAVPRTKIVAHLVRRGFAVESVDGRRQLEEVFMNLVSPRGETDG
jgi:ABC-2 type transport system ATP-binding protein